MERLLSDAARGSLGPRVRPAGFVRRLVPLPARSFRQKMQVLTLTITAGVLILACVAMAGLEYTALRGSMTRSVTALGEAIADNTSASLTFEDRTSAAEILSALRADPSVQAATIYDVTGKPFAAYPDANRRVLEGEPISAASQHCFTRSQLLVSMPIRIGGEVVGRLAVQAGLGEIERLLRRYAGIVVLILCTCLLVAAVISREWMRLAARPIADLVEIALRITEKNDYSLRAPAATDQDLGVLVAGFNAMVTRIEARDAELQRGRDELESRVEERTVELKAAKDQAEEASRAKSEFLANISHELRTPMHAVLSFATLGRKRSLEAAHPKLVDYFEKINLAGNRLLILLNDLLDLSKFEAGRMVMTFAPARLNLVVRSAVEELRSLSHERGLRILCDGDVPGEVVFDHGRMLQVLRNLLGNAIKFSPDGARVWVRFGRESGRIVLVVEDEGIGVPDDELEKVFDKFVQSRKTKTGAGGTGLGLAICRQIVEAHRGRVWADPGRRVGAAFRVEFPDDLPVTGVAGSDRTRATSASQKIAKAA